ncbi:hypothetical protein [Desertimonas flava]|uniref:hypothetical protein n=1 Tax=Desertimonas flava TaxID=2064846 RepID=UPI000E35753B|nr:hypothetical protein [Desertimonas flava]
MVTTKRLRRKSPVVANPAPVGTRVVTTPQGKRGRPALILEGWNESSGGWSEGSPAHRVITAVRTGAFLNAAAEYARLNKSTVTNWLARGREHRPDVDYDRTDIDVEHRPYVDFLEAVRNADGSYEVELTGLTLKAAREDPKFALQVLSRRYPHWRESSKLELASGPAEEETADPLEQMAEHPAMIAQLAKLSHDLEDLSVDPELVAGSDETRRPSVGGPTGDVPDSYADTVGGGDE